MELTRLKQRLEGLEDASVKGYPIRNLHSVMNIPEIWYEAYANIYSNKGAMTASTDDDTLDGTTYLTVASATCTTVKEHTFDLGETHDTDFETAISGAQGWWALGIRPLSNTRDGLDRNVHFGAEEHATATAPTLEITYVTLPGPPVLITATAISR